MSSDNYEVKNKRRRRLLKHKFIDEDASEDSIQLMVKDEIRAPEGYNSLENYETQSLVKFNKN